jgi:transcriptional regulator with XRE-family HTH domain
MKDRILKFITHEGLSATKFADEIGVQRSGVSHILSGRNNPGFDFIQKILSRYRNLSAEWLIMGTGSMYKSSGQADLFSIPENPVSKTPILPKETPLESIKSPIIADILSSPEGDIQNKPTTAQEIPFSRDVEKIVIFYSDKTFEEYKPSK